MNPATTEVEYKILPVKLGRSCSVLVTIGSLAKPQRQREHSQTNGLMSSTLAVRLC